MNGIKIKDLIVMTKYLRFDIDSAKRQLEPASEEFYIKSLKRKIENLEPSLERCEFFIDNLTISVNTDSREMIKW